MPGKIDNDKNKDVPVLTEEQKKEIRKKIDRLCSCDRILSDSEIADFGDFSKFKKTEDDIIFDSDECNDDLEAEYLKLSHILDLPSDTYSLTKIETNLPSCVKYGFRSGQTHIFKNFSPLPISYRGSAVAIAAIVTSFFIKSHCWNEFVIDQIIQDGQAYCDKSYEIIKTDDRCTLTVLDLKRYLDIRNTHRITIEIDDPIYAGTFRSESPKDLHIAKALDLFFRKYNSGVLTSSILNIAIWKSNKHYNIFDGQPRLENCEISNKDESGTAKLILVSNIAGVLFIILEKSNVGNESFVLYGINIKDARKLSEIPNDAEQILPEPQRRPSGYRIQEKFRAVVQGSFHIEHHILPTEFRGRGHLIIAVAALIYSKLLRASKWTKVIIDLIFNQSNIFLTDLARILGKPLNEKFNLKINDLLCDVILGVYTAKIKVDENIIPGQGKKGKAVIDGGIRTFFSSHSLGIIEIKKVFYAIWRENHKFYFLDPFACDGEGFRVDSEDLEQRDRYKQATACVTMNSSIDQLVETILENTESKEKDPFIIHGLSVLYIKTGNAKDGSDEKVIFREKSTNRRPQRPSSPLSIINECVAVIDTLPRPRHIVNLPINEVTQYPELIEQVEIFMESFLKKTEAENENKKSSHSTANIKLNDDTETDSLRYKIVNPHRLILQGTKNCLDEKFHEKSQGRQGLIIALAVITYAQLIHPSEWDSDTVDQIIENANIAYEQIVSWIFAGSPEGRFDENTESLEMKESSADNESASEHYKEESQAEVKGLNFLKLSMVPNEFKVADNIIKLRWKENIIEGETNPLANLGEALEHYFEHFEELILENKKLLYCVHKKNNKYFIFNPYGSDHEGWRNNVGPAAFFVVDSIIELVNLLYGILEFNDFHFSIHFVKVILKSKDQNFDDEAISEISEIKRLDRYQTKFLPVTQDDLIDIKNSKEQAVSNSIGYTDNQEKYLLKNENFENETEKKFVESNISLMLEEILTDLFEQVEEPEQVDPPFRLNLALITNIVKINNCEENTNYEESLEIFYEKLKYKHPPPFITPPKKNLCDILDVKMASKSRHSLLSRFSIDSKLAIKERLDLPLVEDHNATISFSDNFEKSKLITLPQKKYLFSKSLPFGLTPIRAINEVFIRDKEIDVEEEAKCRLNKLKEDITMVVDESKEKLLPIVIPLGPCIKTPKAKHNTNKCPDKKKRKCPLSIKELEDTILKRLVCSTENLIFEMIFPDFKEYTEPKQPCELHEIPEQTNNKSKVIKEKILPEPCGFQKTDKEHIGIIRATTCLENRDVVEEIHYKSCYYSAILCILAKINFDVRKFRGEFIDRFIAATKKILEGTGKLRYKLTRWFRNLKMLGIKCHMILKQYRYADPQNFEPDTLSLVLKSFLSKNQTGIITFGNVSYAFWCANNIYYLFDPYACDENGRAGSGGNACLMEICDFDSLLDRITENTGKTVNMPYRLYTVSIAHLEEKKKRKKKTKRKKTCKEQLLEEELQKDECESNELSEVVSEVSVIELTEWVNRDNIEISPVDKKIPGFSPIKNYCASALEVEVLGNDITRPILAPLKNDNFDDQILIRTEPYDRDFYAETILAEPLDLCIIAWAQIYEPPLWSIRTLQALFEASKELTQDSNMASEDTSIQEMSDGLLSDFNIANYNFRIVFAPMHVGTLYTKEGWNLAMSLEKIFDSAIYTGAVLVCKKKHIGIMKKGDSFYAWWPINWTKKIRIIISETMEDYLKLIVKEINEPMEIDFNIRIVTISYAKIVGPNCSDLEGLHESMMPSTSMTKIHRKGTDHFNVKDIFRPIEKSQTPAFILGSVALLDRDTIIEPLVKRCYFAAVFAVTLKRDIIQNPLPGMIDKVLELADATYKLFEEPKFHTEHILKDINLMDRTFEFRDCSSPVISLLDKYQHITQSVFTNVKKQLKHFFKTCTSGIIQFSNCCYGFWYSETTKCYYYLDPYQCTEQGRRVSSSGKSCLLIFSTICDMASQMCLNQCKETTGFFIHRIHVESVNSLEHEKFEEDPIWIYLDYHWSHRHIGKIKCRKIKNRKEIQPGVEDAKKTYWKNYIIEVPNMIYSVWGSLGAFDRNFGGCTGKNQAAICIAAFAMRNICHPSEWNTAILDSAVVCGDRFYKESKKVLEHCSNKFQLLECLQIFSYLWNLEFSTDICGILYGSREQLNLAVCIEEAIRKSPNLLLQCQKKILGVLLTSDAFYIVDSAWTGPPLFSKDRGAIYTIRCKNVHTMSYVITKMLNTNQRLEFSITPVSIVFKQLTCQSSDSKPKTKRKKILDKPVHTSPSVALNHPSLVSGSVVVSDEDSFLCYSRNLKLGLARGAEFEKAKKLIPEDDRKTLSVCSEKNKVTTSTHNTCKTIDTIMGMHANLKFNGSSASIMNKNISCPRILNLVKDIKYAFEEPSPPNPLAAICKPKKWFLLDKSFPNTVKSEKKLDVKSSFVLDKTREVFEIYNFELQKSIYKKYRHLEESAKDGEMTKSEAASESVNAVINLSEAESEKEEGTEDNNTGDNKSDENKSGDNKTVDNTSEK